ncbi:MAG: hypothetical protein LWW85_03590 [Marinilabiliales bacterium]|nr:hypothetical protein [Marinilabiliales bacterium]
METFLNPLGIAIQDKSHIVETGTDQVVADHEHFVPILHAFARDFFGNAISSGPVRNPIPGMRGCPAWHLEAVSQKMETSNKK